MADQTERAFQQQQGVFAFAKGRGKGKKSATKRFVRNVGLGFKTPKEASEGTYVDKHCPFTGTVSVRGRVLKGLVHRCKMNKTIIVRRDYLHYVSKYNRYEKRHKNIPAHLSPCFRVANGDQVTIGQTRPIAKTVQFTVLDVSAGRETKLKGFAKF